MLCDLSVHLVLLLHVLIQKSLAAKRDAGERDGLGGDQCHVDAGLVKVKNFLNKAFIVFQIIFCVVCVIANFGMKLAEGRYEGESTAYALGYASAAVTFSVIFVAIAQALYPLRKGVKRSLLLVSVVLVVPVLSSVSKELDRAMEYYERPSGEQIEVDNSL